VGVSGALATAPQRARSRAAEAPADRLEENGQAILFSSPTRVPHKVIPFESIAGPRTEAPQAPRSPARRPPARPPKAADTQGALDFLPPAPRTARKLRTTVEAKICCDASVAVAMHRAMAAALDLSMVMIAYGLFLLTFHLGGGEMVLNQQTIVVFGAAFVLTAMFYGLLWVLAQADSPGKHWARLRLTNFDGFPPDGRQRAIRFAATCVSIAPLGAGVAWALLDEESLTWHDHMSETFLTPRGSESNFVRQR
jgi:uncharacterized RDD family membrane protein YckC